MYIYIYKGVLKMTAKEVLEKVQNIEIIEKELFSIN